MSDRKPLDLDAIEARVNQITQGPCKVLVPILQCDLTINGHVAVVPDYHAPVAYCMDRIDAEFIAHCWEDIPALIAELRQVREELAEARNALKSTAFILAGFDGKLPRHPEACRYNQKNAMKLLRDAIRDAATKEQSNV